MITAVALGVILASLLFVNRMTEMQLNSITAITKPGPETPLTEAEAQILEKADNRILLFHLGGPMSFGAAKGMARRLAGFGHYDILILDLSDVPAIDYSTCRTLEDMLANASNMGRYALLAGLKPPVEKLLERQGVLDSLRKEQSFPSRLQALEHAAGLLEATQVFR